MKKENYDFVGVGNGIIHHLECPECDEKLTQFDIDFYKACPFCDYELSLNDEMEDFILKPAIDIWTRNETVQNMQKNFTGNII